MGACCCALHAACPAVAGSAQRLAWTAAGHGTQLAQHRAPRSAWAGPNGISVYTPLGALTLAAVQGCCSIRFRCFPLMLLALIRCIAAAGRACIRPTLNPSPPG
jgi:hypothetical protein